MLEMYETSFEDGPVKEFRVDEILEDGISLSKFDDSKGRIDLSVLKDKIGKEMKVYVNGLITDYVRIVSVDEKGISIKSIKEEIK